MRKLISTKAFISLFAQNFFIFCSFSVLNVLPVHLTALGASKTYVGFFMNLNSLALLLLVVPLSRYADRIGRKRIMNAAYAAALASAAGSFAFPASLGTLALFRVPNVLLFCAVFTIQGAEAFGLFPRERRMSGMALFGISGISSNPVGSFIGERLMAGPGPRWLFAAVFALAAAGYLFSVPYRFHEGGKKAAKAPLFALARRKELAPLFALAFMLGGAYAVFATFLANMTRERLGTVNISVFFAAFSAIAIVIRLFLGSFIERKPPYLLSSACYAMVALAFFMTFGLRDPFMLAPIGFVYGIGHSVLFPLLSTLFVNAGTDEERLALNNLYSAANTLGSLISAVAMGAVADAFGLPAVFLVMAVLAAALVPLGYVGLRGRPAPLPLNPVA